MMRVRRRVIVMYSASLGKKRGGSEGEEKITPSINVRKKCVNWTAFILRRRQTSFIRIAFCVLRIKRRAPRSPGFGLPARKNVSKIRAREKPDFQGGQIMELIERNFSKTLHCLNFCLSEWSNIF